MDIDKKEIAEGQERFLKEYKKKKLKKLFLVTGITSLFYVVGLSIVFILAISIKKMPDESMSPTIKKDEIIIINKLSYFVREIVPGDVIYYKSNDDYHVGRVISKGKSEVFIKDGVIYEDEFLLKEKYLDEFQITPDFYNENYSLKPDEVFVLADNRYSVYEGTGFDSRIANLKIDKSDIIGKVLK